MARGTEYGLTQELDVTQQTTVADLFQHYFQKISEPPFQYRLLPVVCNFAASWYRTSPVVILVKRSKGRPSTDGHRYLEVWDMPPTITTVDQLVGRTEIKNLKHGDKYVIHIRKS